MLTITVDTLNSAPLAPPLTATFGEVGGTIGRAAENTLVLTDPDRKISRTHAVVFHRDGAYGLRDQGSVVPVQHNGQPIGNGREVTLADGDELRIAGYGMRIKLETAMMDTIGTAIPINEATGEMAAPVLSWANQPAAAPGEGIQSIEISTPEISGVAPPPPEPAPVIAPVSEASPRAAEPPPVATVSAAPAAPSSSNDELVRALLKGAGLSDVEIRGGLSPELMRQLGELMSEATHGLVDLLAARANAKRQVRADMTVIVTHDNNPLKFSPNVETAIAQLLVPKGKGFMPPLRAVADSYEDLRTHQQGFMDGMRSALAVVLARFDPKALEERMSEHSMVGSLLPTTRKAKLWDQFGNLYGDITKEAESDFHTLFGQEFLKAYQAKANRTPNRGEPPPAH